MIPPTTEPGKHSGKYPRRTRLVHRTSIYLGGQISQEDLDELLTEVIHKLTVEENGIPEVEVGRYIWLEVEDGELVLAYYEPQASAQNHLHAQDLACGFPGPEVGGIRLRCTLHAGHKPADAHTDADYPQIAWGGTKPGGD